MNSRWRAAVGLVFVAGCAKPAAVAVANVAAPPPKAFDAQDYVLIGVVDPAAVAQARYVLNGQHVHARVWVRPDDTESGVTTLLESFRGKYRFQTTAELAQKP